MMTKGTQKTDDRTDSRNGDSREKKTSYLRNECLFGMSESVLGRFVCSSLRFIPHEPRKKDTHSLYLQCFQQVLSKILREKL